MVSALTYKCTERTKESIFVSYFSSLFFFKLLDRYSSIFCSHAEFMDILCASKIFCRLTNICKHFFSYALFPIYRINSKFHNLRNTFRMMQLPFKS